MISVNNVIYREITISYISRHLPNIICTYIFIVFIKIVIINIILINEKNMYILYEYIPIIVLNII